MRDIWYDAQDGLRIVILLLVLLTIFTLGIQLMIKLLEFTASYLWAKP